MELSYDVVAHVQVNSFDYTKESLEPSVNQSTDEKTRYLCQNIKAYLYNNHANLAQVLYFKDTLPVYWRILEADKQEF